MKVLYLGALTMKKWRYLFLILCAVTFHLNVYSQSTYEVGVSTVSIEPSKEAISLTLGGYAAPWAGRFTLQWIEREKLQSISAITAIDNDLYIVSNNDLYKSTLSKPSEWKKIGKMENVRFLSGLNNMLFALIDGKIHKADLRKKRIRWTEFVIIPKSAKAFSYLNNKLYFVDEQGMIWSTEITDRTSKWEEISSLKLNGITSLSANNDKLYALTNNGTLYECNVNTSDKRWKKIAYKNGVTIKEDIQQIVIAKDNTIYGVDANSILYKGEHRSNGELSARSLAIKDGKNVVVIVALDVVGINDTFTQLVKSEIHRNTGISPSGIFINVSHTHFAPVTQNWLTWQDYNQYPDSSYLYVTVKEAIIKAVNEAIANTHKAELFFGRGKTDIGFNRSLTENPELYDNSVDVIKIKYVDENRENYLFTASCHPVSSTDGALHYTISANFPGVARKLVEERTNTSNSVFLQGTAGDINPRDNGEKITGQKLADDVISILNSPMEKINGSISFYLDTINIPIIPKTKEEIIAFRKEYQDNPNEMLSERNRKWSDLMLDYHAKNKMPRSLPIYVQTLNIGNWKLIGFSRETTSEYGLGVKNLWPEKMVSVTGFTNDVSSYLPTKLHIHKGNYEGLDSFFWYGMPNTFPDTVYETIISYIKQKNR